MRCAVALLAAFAAGAGAQPYPNKPIRVINPAAPGGNSDIVFRVIAPKMGEIVGQQFVLDYRAGCGRRDRRRHDRQEPARRLHHRDRRREFFFNPALIKNLPYDTVKDFTPLGLVVDIPAAVVVHPSLPVKTSRS